MREPLPRPLTFRYVGALLAIAGLLVAGQLLVQGALDRQEGDARVVNTAGRQRMLSQRLCMLLLAHDLSRVDEVASEWETSQRELEQRDNSDSVRSLFAKIDDDHRAMLAAARAGDATTACAHEDDFLAGMDRIVAEYEREARARVITLRAVELVLLALALAVLLLEGAFVFRPAVRALRLYLAQRDRAEHELVEVADRERERLARDLHDGLSQHLVGIAFLVEALEHDATETQRDHLDEIGKLIGEAIEQARMLARGLYSPALEAEGLAGALRALAAQTERVFGVACRADIESDLPEPAAPVRDHLYRIAREAVINAAKHARGSAIDVDLGRAGRELVLRVRDDGVGVADRPGDGLGLQMMRYRARMVGAVLDVSARDGGGTIVTCRLTS